MILGTSLAYTGSQTRTAEHGDDQSGRDGLGNGRPGTASLTDGRVTAERAEVGTAAGRHRCV